MSTTSPRKIVAVGRTQPDHSLEAELSTLGGLILDNSAWPDVSAIVRESDFFEEKNRIIFSTIQDLATAGKPSDPVTLLDELERTGQLADAGGATWLGQLCRDTPSAANVTHYAQIVRRKSLERQRAGAIKEGYHDRAAELTASIKALEAGPQAATPLFIPSAISETVKGFLKTSPPPRKMLFEGFLPLGKAAGLVSPGGAGKSQLLLQMGISVASGLPFFGYEVSSPGSAVLIFAEEDTDELHRRLHNTIAFYEDNGIFIDRELLTTRLLLVSVAGQQITFTHLDRDGNLCWSPDLDKLLLSLHQCQDLRLVGIDPVVNFYAGDENSNTDMMRFMSAMVHIATETGATVLLSHHTNKAATMTGNGAQAGAARGGSAFTNALRWQANLVALDRKELAKFGIGSDKAGFYLGFAVAKSNYTRPIAPMYLYRDRNGVLTPTKLQAQEPGESKLEVDSFLVRDALTKASNEGIEYSKRKARDLLPSKLGISQVRVRAAIDYGLDNQLFFEVAPTTRQPHQVGKVLSVTKPRDSGLQRDEEANPQEIDAGTLRDGSGLPDTNPQPQEGSNPKLRVSGLSSGLRVSGLERVKAEPTHISPCIGGSCSGLAGKRANPQKLLINQSGLRVKVGPLRGSSGLTHYPAGNDAGANGAPSVPIDGYPALGDDGKTVSLPNGLHNRTDPVPNLYQPVPDALGASPDLDEGYMESLLNSPPPPAVDDSEVW